MEKIILKGTYGYKNFINSEEKTFFVNWVDDNKKLFKENRENRQFVVLKNADENIREVVKNLKERIIRLDNITEWLEEPTFYDYIGVNKNGGSIHKHTDPNLDGYIHTRWNVLISYPGEGGDSIYGNEINKLEEKMIWKCEAGLVEHGSLPVVGDTPRITLSLGFQIKRDKKIIKSFI